MKTAIEVRKLLRSLLGACAVLVLWAWAVAPVAFASNQGAAQQGAPTTASDESLDSPQATMFEFLGAIHAVRAGDEQAWTRVLDCFDFEGAGLDPQGEAARRTAQDLWSALNHLRLVERSDLPDAQASAGMDAYLYFPRLFDEDDEALRNRAELETEQIELARMADGAWRFTADTVRSVGGLRRALSKFDLVVDPDELDRHDDAWLRKLAPESLRRVAFLELEHWQWIGLALIALMGFLVDFLVRPSLGRAVGVLLRRFENIVQDDTRRTFLRASGLLSAGVAWALLLPSLALPSGVENILISAARTFAILAGTWCGWRFADLASEALMHAASKTASKFDDVIVPLVRKSVKILVTVFGVIYAAQSLRIDVMPLITGLGIGGLAFAFAAKDTIENFFGSIAVVLDRPFEVGDWVIVGDVEGTVEELGFRSTRVRTFYNSQITIPNSTLVRATVDNYGRRRFRRWKTTLGVQYDTTPDQLIAFTEGLRELVRSHPYTRKDYYQIWCNEFGASSLDILLYIFFEAPDWSTELRERERMFVDIVRLADRLGVQFAFPTQTVHLYREEHAPTQSQHEPPGTSTERRAMVQGIRAARELVADQPWRASRPAGVKFGAAPDALDDVALADPTRSTEDTHASEEPA